MTLPPRRLWKLHTWQGAHVLLAVLLLYVAVRLLFANRPGLAFLLCLPGLAWALWCCLYAHWARLRLSLWTARSTAPRPDHP